MLCLLQACRNQGQATVRYCNRGIVTVIETQLEIDAIELGTVVYWLCFTLSGLVPRNGTLGLVIPLKREGIDGSSTDRLHA